MILIERENVQLRIEERELDKYLAMGFVKYEPKKVEVKETKSETKTIKKALKEEE